MAIKSVTGKAYAAPSRFDEYQAELGRYLAANPNPAPSNIDYSTPLTDRAGDSGQVSDDAWQNQQYNAWLKSLPPDQQAEYKQVSDAKYSKGQSTIRGAFMAAMAAMTAGGALASQAGAAGATGAVGSAGGELTAGLSQAQIAALAEGANSAVIPGAAAGTGAAGGAGAMVFNPAMDSQMANVAGVAGSGVGTTNVPAWAATGGAAIPGGGMVDAAGKLVSAGGGAIKAVTNAVGGTGSLWGPVISAGAGLIANQTGLNAAGNAADAALAQQQAQADAQAKLGQDQLAFNKQVYTDGQAARDAALKQSQQVSDAQVAGMQFATDQAKADQAYRVGTFQPLEKGIVADATGYDTQQRRLDAAASAQADVDQSFAATNAAGDRDLARSGIAPGSGKAMSLMQDASIAQAASRAGAGTMAVRNVEQQGYARKMDAASLGRNLPANQAVQQQIAQTTGTAATGASTAGLVAQQSGVPSMNQGYSGAAYANGSAGNLYGNVANAYNQVANANQTGFGQLASAAGNVLSSPQGQNWMSNLFTSDKKVKSGTGKPADKKKALAQINATPVEDGWRYDPAKGGPNDGGVRHTGPMAQNVRRTMGSAVAPGGKAIDMVSMNGRLMAGMQALTDRVKRLEQRRSA